MSTPREREEEERQEYLLQEHEKKRREEIEREVIRQDLQRNHEYNGDYRPVTDDEVAQEKQRRPYW